MNTGEWASVHPRQKLRIILQFNAGDDSRPRWLMLHSSVFTDDTTPEILSDTLQSIEQRITTALKFGSGNA